MLIAFQQTWVEKEPAGVDAIPSYLVVGGLVFMRLSLPWLLSRYSEVLIRGAQLGKRMSWAWGLGYRMFGLWNVR